MLTLDGTDTLFDHHCHVVCTVCGQVTSVVLQSYSTLLLTCQLVHVHDSSFRTKSVELFTAYPLGEHVGCHLIRWAIHKLHASTV